MGGWVGKQLGSQRQGKEAKAKDQGREQLLPANTKGDPQVALGEFQPRSVVRSRS